ncbi:uncharacterized protein DFL_006967 [Arthrobotrys flagrans]|uniref:Uncharacterized protein n=1 Tax=Arthrobotrys flagrans TaxID=97331 RepID=A0A436ZUW3_ARTFL|nr:hypothetical protein DFL_006967 [Arthrobotrys flagrans]
MSMRLSRRKVLGALTFRYSYDAKHEIVTVCGTDFPSADGMALVTRPEGTEQFAYEHAADAGFAPDEVHHNRNWNYNSPLMPGAAKTLPAGFPLEHYMKLSTVHHPDGKLLGNFDPAHKYDEGVQIRELGSYYDGRWNSPVNWQFANVIGSTPDPNHEADSWIALWKAAYNNVDPVGCTSLDFPSTVTCGNSIVGGHVIAGQVPGEIDPRSNSVLIFPICRTHNGNNMVYMEAIIRQNAIYLSNYMN